MNWPRLAVHLSVGCIVINLGFALDALSYGNHLGVAIHAMLGVAAIAQLDAAIKRRRRIEAATTTPPTKGAPHE